MRIQQRFLLVCQPDAIPVVEHPDTHFLVVPHLDFDVKEIPSCLFLSSDKHDVRPGRIKVLDIFVRRRTQADARRIIVHTEPGIDKRDDPLL